jgi:hypothetical protein
MFLVRKTFESKILEPLVSVSRYLSGEGENKAQNPPFFKLYWHILRKISMG